MELLRARSDNEIEEFYPLQIFDNVSESPIMTNPSSSLRIGVVFLVSKI